MHPVLESCPSQGWDQISHEEDTVLASEEGDDSSVLQIEGGGDSPTVYQSSPSCTGVALLPGWHTGNPPSWEKPPKVGGREGFKPILRDCVRPFAINQLTSAGILLQDKYFV